MVKNCVGGRDEAAGRIMRGRGWNAKRAGGTPWYNYTNNVFMSPRLGSLLNICYLRKQSKTRRL